jgi:metallophosphoesterase superfamily enzyme
MNNHKEKESEKNIRDIDINKITKIVINIDIKSKVKYVKYTQDKEIVYLMESLSDDEINSLPKS